MSATSRARHRNRTAYFAYLAETSKPVDSYVSAFFTQQLSDSPLLDFVMSRYRFGKPKLRPAQVRWAYELAGGDNWTSILPMCAAVEVKDSGYYCLDDVFDKGGDARILSVVGGVLSTLAHDMAATVADAVSHERFMSAISELCRLDYRIAQGAIIELNMRGTDEAYSLQKADCFNYWQHVMKIGAILGGGNENTVSTLEAIGKDIGKAYIIANDTYEYGKEKLEDFPTGICTLPVVYALEHACADDQATLRSRFGNGALSADEENAVRRIMVRSGAIGYGQSKARELCDAALELLSDFPDVSARRMIEFSTTMTQRNKYFSALSQLAEGAVSR